MLSIIDFIGCPGRVLQYQHSFCELTSTKTQSWLRELAPTRTNTLLIVTIKTN